MMKLQHLSPIDIGGFCSHATSEVCSNPPQVIFCQVIEEVQALVSKVNGLTSNGFDDDAVNAFAPAAYEDSNR